MEEYIYKNRQKLRLGYTTGSCAAAAAKAAAVMALSLKEVPQISIMTPKKIELHLKVWNAEFGKNYGYAAIQKDAGDDADVTDKSLICARVELKPDLTENACGEEKMLIELTGGKDEPDRAETAEEKDKPDKAETTGCKDEPDRTETAEEKDKPDKAETTGWKDEPDRTETAEEKDKPDKAETIGWKDEPDKAETIGWEYESDKIEIDGGTGVGRITKPGLDQPVGSAAINKVPRKMILEEVTGIFSQYDYKGSAKVIISVPDGENLAKRTFNPNLGIEGGISILGTSGIVEPMSERALIDTIAAEIRMHTASGAKYLLFTPGNYGMTFLKDSLHISVDKNVVKCSNFIGDAIDLAYPYKLKGILFVGHIGKMVKLAVGIMNTHSKMGDARMEALVSCALEAGADNMILNKILNCIATDEAIQILKDNGILEKTMGMMMKRIRYHLQRRADECCQVEAIVFSNQLGILGKTKGAEELLKYWKNS